AELDSKPKQLRPVRAGPKATRAHLELRPWIPAHFQSSYAADGQSLHSKRPIQLLPQRRFIRRYPGHAEPEPAAPELGCEERSRHPVRTSQLETGPGLETNAPAREFRLWHHRSDI